MSRGVKSNATEPSIPAWSDMVEELLAKGDDVYTGIARIIESEAYETCKVCNGDGHHSGQCPLLKKMTKACSGSSTLKKEWGLYKSTKKVNVK